MGQLIDEIISNRNRIPIDNVYSNSMDGIGQAEQIMIDNVDHYIQSGKKQEYEPSDFPNIAPPFPLMFLSVEDPVRYVYPDGVKTPRCDFGREHDDIFVRGWKFGVLSHTREIMKAHDPIDLECISDMNSSRLELQNNDDVQWVVRSLVFSKHPAVGWLHMIGALNDFVRSDGTHAFTYSWKNQSFIDSGCVNKEHDTETDKAEYYISDFVNTLMIPVRLAISLMHCKNVTVRVPKLSRQQMRQSVRKRGGVKYKILEIEPMINVLRDEGKSDTVGVKQALHICRGHFKDYREKGLFGKHKEVYWWDSQKRGSIENGVILKDYAIGKQMADMAVAN